MNGIAKKLDPRAIALAIIDIVPVRVLAFAVALTLGMMFSAASWAQDTTVLPTPDATGYEAGEYSDSAMELILRNIAEVLPKAILISIAGILLIWLVKTLRRSA